MPVKTKTQEALRIVISLDVEEEGLFSGRYAERPTVRNVASLLKLRPLSQRFNFPLTLLCSYAVFRDRNAQKVLEEMRDKAGAEIGLHLHHWSTPPLPEARDRNLSPERTHLLPSRLLRERLYNLAEEGRKFQSASLTSFRMGRWDLKAGLLPMLEELGITVDSSICPLRSFPGGADHFLAPADPYWHKFSNGRQILEAPITQIPINAGLARLWETVWKKNPQMLDKFHFFGALSANPLWHSEAVMKQATRLHVARGGKLLNLFLHSSELMPGGSPHVPDARAADRIVKKLESFCDYLVNNYNCAGITMNCLPGLGKTLGWSTLEEEQGRDW